MCAVDDLIRSSYYRTSWLRMKAPVKTTSLLRPALYSQWRSLYLFCLFKLVTSIPREVPLVEYYSVHVKFSTCLGERQQVLHGQYSSHNKDVEELLQQLKNLEKSNYYLSQTNETLKSQMGIQVCVCVCVFVCV